MGASTSHDNPLIDQRRRSVQVKLAVTRTLNKGRPLRPKGHTRADVMEFIRAQKAEKEQLWKDLENERQNTGKHVKEVKSSETPEEPDLSGICGLCGKVVPFDPIPCRVCGRDYHSNCVKETGQFSDEEMESIHSMQKKVGWSCLECDNVCGLLNPAEMQELVNIFDAVDTNKDAVISLEEYLEAQKQIHLSEEGTPMTEVDVEFERIQFKSMDRDGNGTLECMEVFKYLACRALARRDKAELVTLLTKREKASAREQFDVLDTDNDGLVVARDMENYSLSVLGGYHAAISAGLQRQDPHSPPPGLRKPIQYSHQVAAVASRTADLLMDADEDGDKVVTWDEFIKNSAIYMLSSRPN